MNLTVIERLMLANQYKILSNQYKILQIIDNHPEFNYEKEVRILEDGLEGEYYHHLSKQMDTSTTQEERALVYRILSMYTSIQDSIKNIVERDPSSGLVNKGVFFGFDTNTEESLRKQAYFIIHHDGLFTSLRIADRDGEKTLASPVPAPFMPLYQKQLEIWERLEKKSTLTEDEVNELMKT